MSPSEPEVHTAFGRLLRAPAMAGALVLVMSGTVLLGWATGNRTLQSFYPGFVTMKANTAIGLGLAALSLLLLSDRVYTSPRRREVAASLALLLVVLGAATTAQYILGLDLGIDQLFMSATAEAHLTTTPGRMAAVTAVAFIITGAALILAARRRESTPVAHFLTLGIGTLGLTALLGYVYGAIPTEGIGQGIQIAPHTAAGLVLLSIGILAIRPDVGWIPTLLSEQAGGVLARRLLPVVFLVPFALGFFRLLGVSLGWYGTASGGAAVAVATMIAFGFVIWRTAGALNDTDRLRQAAEEERMELAMAEEAARQRADSERVARVLAERARASAEHAATEKEDALTLLNLVLDSTPVGFALLGPDLRYQRVNPALAAITGVPVEMHGGRGVTEVSPEFDGLEAMLRKVLTTGVPMLSAEWCAAPAGGPGQAEHCLASAYPIRRGSGEIVGVGLTVVDTSERWRLEAQLVHSQKMEAVGLLAGGIAHDFNNMLTAVISYADLLLEDFEATDARRADVSEISKAAHRAAALTRQLLVFSRRQALNPTVVDLNGSVTEIRNMLSRLIGAHIDVSTHLSDRLGTVMADAGQMEQVIMNLVMNARDAMPEGGRIVIETANVELDDSLGKSSGLPVRGPHVMLSVTDTGVGMSRETQERIFEPFFTTKELGKGTGLGLATVYAIVQQAGGHLRVHSGLGKGTTFKVYLPRVDAKADTPLIAEVPVPVEQKSGRVLVVEDDSAVRSVVLRILRKSGYDVIEAANGTTALAIGANADIPLDLVVTDMVMPEMGGIEFAERLRVHRPDVRLLFMSGYTEETVTRQRLLAPGSAFIEKPFTPDALMGKIREVLDSPAGVPPRRATEARGR